MTRAVCFKCGVIKFGAYVPCPECAAFPQTEDELVISLAMTDHYFDPTELEEIGHDVRTGRPPRLDPDDYAELVQSVRDNGLVDQVAGMAEQLSAAAQRLKKPWWKFW